MRRTEWSQQLVSSQGISYFSSVGSGSSGSSSYYRSSYLDSSPSNNSYSSTYSYPSYESKYQALLNRNPDGAGKSRSGEFFPEIRDDKERIIMQELRPSTTICPVMQATPPVKTRLRTTGQPPMPVLLTQTSWLRTILRNITTNLPPLATVFWRGRSMSGQFRSWHAERRSNYIPGSWYSSEQHGVSCLVMFNSWNSSCTKNNKY